MMYLGDYVEDEVVYFLWSTNDADGASITRATDGTVSVYKNNGTGQSTAGVTDAEDFDSLTGIHACTIDTSADAFYAAGEDYAVVLSAATIDGQTVNAVLAHFSIQNRYMRGTNSAALATALATVDGIVDDILEDTGTTLPATLTTIDGVVDDILVDTGTTLPAAIAANSGSAPSATTVANAVWSTALGAHAAGTAGHKLDLVALASQLQAAVASGAVSTSIANPPGIVRLESWTATISNLADISGRSKLLVSIKEAETDSDNDSLVLWQEGVGLVRLNKAAAAQATDGAITVNDANPGNITLSLKVGVTGSIPAGSHVIAAKVIKADGAAQGVGKGSISVTESTIKAIS
jgi:hypothetical protein